MKKNYIFALFIFGLFFIGCSSDVSVETYDLMGDVEELDVISIGVLAPLDNSVYKSSEVMVKVINLSFNNINLAGGILGKKVNLIFVDSQCSKKFGGLMARDLIEKFDVKFIIGGMCSSGTLGASTFTNDNEVILISPSATSKEISDAGEYVYRLAISDSLVAESLAEAAIKNGHKKIAMYFERTDFTESFRNDFVKKYSELGGEFSVHGTFDIDDVDKFYSDVALISNSDSDSILFLTQSGIYYDNIISKFKELGINLPIYTNEKITDDVANKNNLEYLKGAMFGVVQSDLQSDESKELIGIVDSYYGNYFSEKILFHFIAASYDIPNLLKYVIEACGTVDSTCVKGELDSLSDYNSYIGEISFDSNGDLDYPVFIQSFGGDVLVSVE